jgi:hypothetical protein
MSNTKTEAKFILRAVELVVLIAAVIGLIYGAGHYIDSRVQALIQNETFIRGLAQRVRPSLIFDEHGSIVADTGASELLESITVTNDPTLKTVVNIAQVGEDVGRASPAQIPNRIVITPKRHMAIAPLLEPLYPVQGSLDARRGVGHQWIYEIHEALLYYQMKDAPLIRFRLEVLGQ